jgi:hypothetical protein
MQDQYYTVMIPKSDRDSDLDRQKRLLELGNPNFLTGGYSDLNNKIASAATGTTAAVKLKSAAVQVNKNSLEIQRKLLALGSVNSFGGSPMAEALAARQRKE